MLKDINRLDYFALTVLVALYEQKSATVVAASLNTSQPRISRALVILREVFDDPLFIRQKYGLEPNAMAETLYPLAKAVLERYQALADAVTDHGVGKTELNIAAQEHLCPLLMECLHLARKEAGLALTFNLHPWTAEVQKQMSQSVLDLSISINPSACDGIDSHEIGQIKRFYLVASRDHPIFEQPLTLDTVFAYPVALFNYSMSGPRTHRLEAVARQLKLPLQVSLKTASLNLLLDHVQKSNSVGFLASALVLESIKQRSDLHYLDMTGFWQQRVKLATDTGSKPSYGFYLQSHQQLDRVFVEALVANLRKRIAATQSQA
ncbi:LysR family transcriptional regulator [Ferrimonas kyonanensis]|uniref:LysR family transcriptional regulator n=1 Tax=Ferrimonas kyonanensis TaxID=364763 RepID=UPI00041CFA2A|nr:LysR family transcriptional regulator [Ferrimonas kyonanensis]